MPDYSKDKLPRSPPPVTGYLVEDDYSFLDLTIVLLAVFALGLTIGLIINAL